MTRTIARVTAGVVVAAAVVVGTAGCDDRTPVAEPPSASASPKGSASPKSTTPAVQKPDRPAAMDDDGPAGAEAAAKYFLKLDAYMQATGDTAEAAAMSHQECETCKERIEQAKGIAASGYVWTGGEATVTVTYTYEKDAVLEAWPIDVHVHDEPVRVTDASGKVMFESPSTDADQRVEVGRRGDDWVIIGIAETPEG